MLLETRMRLPLARLNFTLGAFEQNVAKIATADLSRIEEVFRDRPLAAYPRNVEAGVETDNPRDVADSVAQAIRARYQSAVGGL